MSTSRPADEELSGMTVNERLFACGVLDKWDEATRRRSRAEMIEVLRSVAFTEEQAAQSTDAVLQDPKKQASAARISQRNAMNPMQCPACGKPLSFWNIAKAPTPFHLKCDHCQTKLRFEKHAGSAFLTAMVLGVIVGFATAHLHTGAFIIAVIVAVAVFEIAFFLIASGMNLKLISRAKV